MLNIIQSHYPERLGLALILNVPWILNAFFKLISPFIDPVTRAKMRFNPEVGTVTVVDVGHLYFYVQQPIKDGIFTADQLMTEWWGGDRDFKYEHDKYWPALVEMCDSRRQAQMDKWRELGGTVGLKEWDIKGGTSITKDTPTEVGKADESTA